MQKLYFFLKQIKHNYHEKINVKLNLFIYQTTYQRDKCFYLFSNIYLVTNFTFNVVNILS